MLWCVCLVLGDLRWIGMRCFPETNDMKLMIVNNRSYLKLYKDFILILIRHPLF